jgi:hypothetical protein
MAMKLGFLPQEKNSDWLCVRSKYCGEYLDIWKKRKLRNEALNNLYTSYNIIREKMKNVYKILVQKLKRPLWGLRERHEEKIKMGLKRNRM